jgi:hypothetical protein
MPATVMFLESALAKAHLLAILTGVGLLGMERSTRGDVLVSSVYVQPCRAKQDTFLISISLSSPRSELLHRKTHPFSRTCILSNQPLQTNRHGRKNFRRREARSR